MPPLAPFDDSADLGAPRPLGRGRVFERLHLRQGDTRLTLSSRGPVARWLLPGFNTVPALWLTPALALWGIVAWGLMQPVPPPSPPVTLGTAAVILAVVFLAGLLPLVPLVALVHALGVGRGVWIELDTAHNRALVRQTRLGLPPSVRACELEDARFKLGRASTQERSMARHSATRSRLFAGGLLTALSLVNPLFMMVSLILGRRRAAAASAPRQAVTPLGFHFAGAEPFAGRIPVTGEAVAKAEEFLVAFEKARRERFRFGFANDAPPRG